MNEKKLRYLLKKEENTKLDFKATIDISMESGRKELAKDVCAIANTIGGRGYLVVGIEDKTKKVLGIDENLLKEEQIQQIVSSRCDPPIPITLDFINIDGKTIGVITIYDGNQKPYQMRENGAFYIRRGSTTDVMRKEELISVFQESLNFNVELCPIVRSNIEHLDYEGIEYYFNLQGLNMNEKNRLELMENAGIIINEKESGKYVATMGGLLVFSKINNLYIPHNMIKIINKVNPNVEEIMIVQGKLLDMLDETEKKLYNILPSNYPVKAVYESVKNAVLYRDYAIYYKEIQVIINKGNISVISPGAIAKEKGITSHNYLRRNMWIYEKLILIDDKKRFFNAGTGFSIIKGAFSDYRKKVIFVNSKKNNYFKVIFPGSISNSSN